MRISLSEIIEMPGKSLPFQCVLDAERLMSPSIEKFLSPPEAFGKVSNNAGVLSLSGTITAACVRICDRCGEKFSSQISLPAEAMLAADLSDEDNPEVFPLDGNWLDVSDVLETIFILSTEEKSLCKENCAGLCSQCGKNLNDGPCGCKKEIDPRLAVLGQLLDKKD